MLKFEKTALKFKAKILLDGIHVADLIRTGLPKDNKFTYVVLKDNKRLVAFDATTQTQTSVKRNLIKWLCNKFN